MLSVFVLEKESYQNKRCVYRNDVGTTVPKLLLTNKNKHVFYQMVGIDTAELFRCRNVFEHELWK